jgi:hypothetical protein
LVGFLAPLDGVFGIVANESCILVVGTIYQDANVGGVVPFGQIETEGNRVCDIPIAIVFRQDVVEALSKVSAEIVEHSGTKHDFSTHLLIDDLIVEYVFCFRVRMGPTGHPEALSLANNLHHFLPWLERGDAVCRNNLCPCQ